jgi:hypothetical protein
MVPKDVDIVSMADLIMVAERECMIQSISCSRPKQGRDMPGKQGPVGQKGDDGGGDFKGISTFLQNIFVGACKNVGGCRKRTGKKAL